MAALKTLVIAMAVLIVGGLVLVFLRIGGLIGEDDATVALGDITLGLPSGCRIADIVAADGRLFVHTADGPRPCGAVFVVDVASGTVVGSIGP